MIVWVVVRMWFLLKLFVSEELWWLLVLNMICFVGMFGFGVWL